MTKTIRSDRGAVITTRADHANKLIGTGHWTDVSEVPMKKKRGRPPKVEVETKEG